MIASPSDGGQTENRPKISVITASKNGAAYLKQTMDSILNQRFTDYEHVVADGASSDETVEMLRAYDHIRWKSEPDRHCDEGFYKALQMARGEYIMFCCLSDGYLDPDWFGKCVDILDSNPEVSLVHGLAQPVSPTGERKTIRCVHYLEQPPPQKMEYFPYWVGTMNVFHESTFCVRSEVFRECFPLFQESGHFSQNHALLAFNYNFNAKGYLPFFLPSVASYCIGHEDSSTNKWVALNRRMKKQYQAAVNQYGNDVLSGRKDHVFRDGTAHGIGKIEPDELCLFRRKTFYYRTNRKVCLGKRESNVLGRSFRRFRILLDCLVLRRLRSY